MALYFKGLFEFSAVMAFVGLLPLIVWKKIARREKAWLIGLGGIFFCLAVILMILLNPPPDRQSQDLNRVFFTSSHVVVALFAGYGVALLAGLLSAQYQRYRMVAICAGSVALALHFSSKLALERVHPLDRLPRVWHRPDLGIFDRFPDVPGPCTYLCDSSGSFSGSFLLCAESLVGK